MKNFKTTFKKVLSLLLVAVMLVGTMEAGFGGLLSLFSMKAAAADAAPTIKVAVPETIYLVPNSTSTTAFQYYVNTEISGSGAVSKPAERAQGTGKIYLYGTNVTKASVKMTSGTATVLEAASATDLTRDGSLFTTTITSGSLSAGIAPGTSKTVKWTFSYTEGGANKTTYAYSTVYAPFTGSAAAGGFAETQKNIIEWPHSNARTYATVWLSGVHAVSGGTDAYKYAPLTGNALVNSDNYKMTGLGMHTDSDKSTGGSAGFDVTGGTATLYVDISRYDNYNQIPNLRVGLDINSRDASDRVRPNYVNFDGQQLYYEERTVSGGSRLYDSADAEDGIDISIGNKSKTIQVKGHAETSKNGNSNNYREQSITGYLPISLICVNKQALREKVQEVMAAGYTEDEWAKLDKAFQNACLVLGQPDATEAACTVAVDSMEASVTGLGGSYPEYAIQFTVPETIYLAPVATTTTTKATTFDKYLNNDKNGDVTHGFDDNNGYVYFKCDAATSVSISCDAATVNGKTAGTAVFSSSNSTIESNITSGTLGTGIDANGTTTLTWTATYTVHGQTFTAKNYTVCYAPYIRSVAGISAGTARQTGWSTAATWDAIFGIHEITTSAMGRLTITGAGDDNYDHGSDEKSTCAYRYDLTNHSSTPANYYGGAAPTTSNILSSTYSDGAAYWFSESKDNDGKQVHGGMGKIYYDSSRQSLLSEIPNFHVHTYMSSFNHDGTDDYTKDETNWTRWYMTNASNVTQNYLKNTTKFIKNFSGKVETVTDPDLTKFTLGDGYKFYVISERFWRQRNWIGTHQSTEIWAATGCSFKDTNKTAMRTAYYSAIKSGRQETWYTSDSWTTYATALKNLGEQLGAINPSSTSTAALTDAIGGLTFRTGVFKSRDVSSTGKVLEEYAEQDFNYGQTMTVSTPADGYKGYSYQNFTYNLFDFDAWADTLTNTNITVDKSGNAITLTNNNTSGEVFTQPYAGYNIPIVGGHKYKITANVKLGNASGTVDYMAFLYRNAACTDPSAGTTNYYLRPAETPAENGTDVLTGEITAPSDANYLALRVGVHTPGVTSTFSNIQIVDETASAPYETSDNKHIDFFNVCTACANVDFNYQPITYTATFNPDGGKWSDNTTTNKTNTYTIETVLTAPATVSKAGCKFDGWKVTTAPTQGNWPLNDTFGSAADSTVVEGTVNMYGGVTGDTLVFTAQWDPISYITSFDVNHDDTRVDYFGVPDKEVSKGGAEGTNDMTITYQVGENNVPYVEFDGNTTGWAPAYKVPFTVSAGDRVRLSCEWVSGSVEGGTPVLEFYDANGDKINISGGSRNLNTTGTSADVVISADVASRIAYYGVWFQVDNTKVDCDSLCVRPHVEVCKTENARNREFSAMSYTYTEKYGYLPTPADRTGYTFGGWYPVKYADDATVDTSTQVADTDIAPIGNRTLYAYWAKKSYTLKVYAYGNSATNATTASTTYANTTPGGTVKIGTGTPAASVTGSVKYQNTASITATPATGYVFKGWRTSAPTASDTETISSTATDYTTAPMPASDMTYYALFDIQKYDLAVKAYTKGLKTNGDLAETFTESADGGTASVGAAKVYYGQKGTLIAKPNAGYKFVGWAKTTSDATSGTTSAGAASACTPDSSTGEYSIATPDDMPASKLTYYALFEVNTYTLTVKPYCNTAADQDSYANSTTGGTVSITGGTTDSTGTATKSLRYGQTAKITASPATGYEFAGWTTSDGNAQQGKPDTGTDDSNAARDTAAMGAGDMTYYAIFRIKTYKITAYAYYNTAAALTTFTKGENGGKIKFGSTGEAGDEKYAYVAHDTNCPNDIIATAAEGYVFAGWLEEVPNGTNTQNLNGDGASGRQYVTNVTQAKSYYAVFKIRQYVLTVEAWTNTPGGNYAKSGTGGTVKIGAGDAGSTAEGNVYYDQTAKITAIPATGYAFKGWTTSAEKAQTGDPDTGFATSNCTLSGGEYSKTTAAMPASNITYYALFEIQKYTLTVKAYYNTAAYPDTFNNNAATGGTVQIGSGTPGYSVTDENVYYGQERTLTASNADSAGYDFAGWLEAEPTKDNTTTISDKAASKTVAMGAGNKTYYAVFKIRSYTLTAKAYYNAAGATTTFSNGTDGGTVAINGGTAGASVTGSAYHGTNPTFTATADTSAGYQFAGWMTSEPGNNTETNNLNGTAASDTKTETGITENVTYYAVFKIKQYTLTVYPYYNTATSPTAFVNGTTGGTVSITGGTGNGTATVTKTVDHGQTPEIIAEAATGYLLTGWHNSKNNAMLGYVNADVNGTPTVTADTTLYAIFAVQSYTLTVTSANTDMGTVTLTGATSGTNVYYGAKVKVQANAVTGYEFAGWTVTGSLSGFDASKADEQTFDMPAGEVTLTANFTGRTCRLTFDPGENGGAFASDDDMFTASSPSKTVTYGSRYDTKADGKTWPKEPVKFGYHLIGWYTTQTEGGTLIEPEDSCAYTEDLTVYARYEVNTYNILYELNGGSHGTNHPDTATFGADPFPVSRPTRTGYDFKGWSLSGKINTSTEPATKATCGVGTTSMGDLPSSHTYLCGAYDESYYKNLVSENDVTVTFTADWELHAYTITIDPDGGTVSGLTYFGADDRSGDGTDGSATTALDFNTGSQFVALHNTEITIPKPTKTGYTFNDWTVSPADITTHGKLTNESDGSATYKVGIDDATLTADWTPITYNIAFTKNDTAATGSMDSMTGIEYDEEVTLPACTFEKIGYSFAGWAKSQYGTKEYDDGEKRVFNLSEINGAEVKLYAKWTPIDYTVTFDNNASDKTADGTTPVYQSKPITVNYGGQYPALDTANVMKAVGYTFEGWYTEKYADDATADSAKLVTAGTICETASDHTLYAKWTEHTYTIAFDKNDDGATGEMSSLTGKRYSEEVTLPACTFEKIGYSFAGWATSSDGEKAYDDEAPVSKLSAEDGAEVKLYALWQVNSYILKILTDGHGTVACGIAGATDADGVKVKYGESVTGVQVEFVATGYEFDGWTVSGATPTGFNTSTAGEQSFNMPAGAVTLTANFKASTYTVSFDKNGHGADSSDQSVTYDAEYGNILPAPTETGYTFGGWYTERYTDDETADSAKLVTEDTICKTASDHTLYAKWTENTYTIAFDKNDADDTESMSSMIGIKYNEEVALTACTFEKTGYSFAGWAISADSEKVEYTDGQSVKNLTPTDKATVTLYALWQVNSYILKILTDGHGTVACDIADTESGAEVAYGTSVTGVQVESVATGYEFDKWIVEVGDGVTLSFNASYSAEQTFTMPACAVTLTATFKAKTFKIAFNANTPTDGTVAVGDSVKNIPQGQVEATFDAEDGCKYAEILPTLTGHQFVGWSTMQNPGENDTIYDSDRDITFTKAEVNALFSPALVNLYAVWKVETWRVRVYAFSNTADSFDVYGQNTVGGTVQIETSGTPGASANKDINYNTTANIIASAVDGYKFAGWLQEVPTKTNVAGAEGSATKTVGPIKTTDLYYYAVFQVAEYKLTAYVADACKSMGNVKVGNGTAAATANGDFYFGADATATAVPNTGYHFVAWVDSNEKDSVVTTTNNNATLRIKMPARNVDVTASFAANTYKVTYDLGGGTAGGTQPEDAVYDEAFSVPAPTKTGYTFTGWKLSGTDADFNTAKYGTTDTPGTAINNSATQCENGADGTVYFINLASKDGGTVKLTATWTTNSYPLHVYAYCNTAADRNEFANAATGGTVAISSGATVNSGTNDTEHASGTVVFDQQALITATVKTGYTFKGWLTAEPTALWSGTAQSNEQSTDMMPAQEDGLSYYAVFEVNEYKLTITTSAVSTVGTITPTGVENATYYYGADVTNVAANAAHGYHLSGWTVNGTRPTGFDTTKPEAQDFTMPASDLTLSAVFAADTFTVSFNANKPTAVTAEVTVPENKIATYNQTLNYGEAPAITGYTFKGWRTAGGTTVFDADATGIFYETDIAAMYPGNEGTVALYAIWQIDAHQISVNPNAGTVDVTYFGTRTASGDAAADNATAASISSLTQVNALYGTTVTLAKPVRFGHKFGGWTVSPADGTTGGTLTNNDDGTATYVVGTGDVTLTASWNLDVFSITVEPGSAPTNHPYDSNNNPITVHGTVQDVLYTNSASNASAHATIAWNSGNKTLSTINGTHIYLDEPTCTGYTFTGWQVTTTGTGNADLENDGNKLTTGDHKGKYDYLVGPGNATLTATWRENVYRVVYDANDESGRTYEDCGDVRDDTTHEGYYYYSTPIFILSDEDFWDPNSNPGYKFASWTVECQTDQTRAGETINAHADTSGLSTADGDTVTLYAQWNPIENFIVKYMVDGYYTFTTTNIKTVGSTVKWKAAEETTFGLNDPVFLPAAYDADTGSYYYVDTCIPEDTTHSDGMHCFPIGWQVFDPNYGIPNGRVYPVDGSDVMVLDKEVAACANYDNPDQPTITICMKWSMDYAPYERAVADFQNANMRFANNNDVVRGTFHSGEPTYAALPASAANDSLYTDNSENAEDIASRSQEGKLDADPGYNGGKYGIFSQNDKGVDAAHYAWVIGDVNGNYGKTASTASAMAAETANDFTQASMTSFNEAYLNATSYLITNPCEAYQNYLYGGETNRKLISMDAPMDLYSLVDGLTSGENPASNGLVLKSASLDKQLSVDEITKANPVLDGGKWVYPNPCDSSTRYTLVNGGYINQHFDKTYADAYPPCSDDPNFTGHSFRQIVEMCNKIFDPYVTNGTIAGGGIPVFKDSSGNAIYPEGGIYETSSTETDVMTVEKLYGILYGEDGLYAQVIDVTKQNSKNITGKNSDGSYIVDGSFVKMKKPTQYMVDKVVAKIAAAYHQLQLRSADFTELAELLDDYLEASWGAKSGCSFINKDGKIDYKIYFVFEDENPIEAFMSNVLNSNDEPVKNYQNYKCLEQLYIDGKTTSDGGKKKEVLQSVQTNQSGEPYYTQADIAKYLADNNLPEDRFDYEEGTLCAQLIDVIDHLVPGNANYSSIFNLIWSNTKVLPSNHGGALGIPYDTNAFRTNYTVSTNSPYREQSPTNIGEALYQQWYADFSGYPQKDTAAARRSTGDSYNGVPYLDTQWLYRYYTKSSVDAVINYLRAPVTEMPANNNDGIYWNYDFFQQDQIDGEGNANSIYNVLKSKIAGLTPKKFMVVTLWNTEEGHPAVSTDQAVFDNDGIRISKHSPYTYFVGEDTGRCQATQPDPTFGNWSFKYWSTSPVDATTGLKFETTDGKFNIPFTDEVAAQAKTVTIDNSEYEVLFLYAIWDQELNGVNVDMDGGSVTVTIDGGTPTIGSEGGTFKAASGKKLVLTDPQKEGHTFAGWTFTSKTTGTGTGLIKGTWDDTTDTFTFGNDSVTDEIKANWTVNPYLLTVQAFFNTAANQSVYTGGATGGTVKIGSDTAGASVTKNINYHATASITASKATGYTFKGWTTSDTKAAAGTIDTDRTATPLTTAQMPITGLTYYAIFAVDTYTISLDTNGGTINAGNVGTYVYGAGATLPTDVTKTGFTFNGWYTEVNGAGTKVTAIGANETGDKVYHAYWTENTYYIAFHGGEDATGDMEGMACLYTLTYNLTANSFEKAGHEFLGWSTTENGTNVTYINEAKVTGLTSENGETIDLYAVWSILSYTLTLIEESPEYYDPTTGSLVDTGSVRAEYIVMAEVEGNDPKSYTAEVPYGTTVVLVPEASTGYKFKEWFVSDGVENIEIDGNHQFTMPDSAVTIQVVFEPITYTVAFDCKDPTEGSVCPEPIEGVVYDQVFGLPWSYPDDPNSFYKIGHEFKGWTTNSLAVDVLYERDNFNITTYEYDDLATVDSDMVTLYAVWEQNKYDLSVFNENGGSDPYYGQQPYGAVIELTEPTKTGYTFTGWEIRENEYTYAPSTIDGNTLTMGDGFTYVYATWEADTFNLRYNANAGEDTVTNMPDPAEVMLTYGDESAAISNAVPERTGYTFKGWSHNRNAGVGEYNPSDAINVNEWYGACGKDGTYDLYAIWECNSYTLTVTNTDTHANSVGAAGRELNADQYKVLFGDKVTLTQTAQTGYHFKAWKVVSPDGITVDSNSQFTMPAENVTIDATYEANTYTIGFNGNGNDDGVVMAPQSMTYNAEETPLSENVFTKTGYSFAGWATSADSGEVKYADKQSVKNLAYADKATVNLYAVWQVKCYTLTVTNEDAHADSVGAEGWTEKDGVYTVPYGSAVTLTQTAKDGYHFDAWETKTEGVIITNGSFTMPAKDVTVNAKYAANTYTIRFNGNGNDSGVMASQSMTYDAEETPLSENIFTRTGYSFAGWATSKEGEVVYADKQPVKNLTATDNATVTLFAVWQVASFKLTVTNKDTHAKSVGASAENMVTAATWYEVPYNAEVTLTQTAKDGYHFNAWSTEDVDITDSCFTMPAKEVTVDATYEPNTYTVAFDKNNTGATGSMTDETFTYGEEKALPANKFSLQQYTFDSWNTQPDGKGTAYADGAAVSNLAYSGTVTLYAQWKLSTFTLTFNANDGQFTAGGEFTSDPVQTKQITFGMKYGDPDTASKAWPTKPTKTAIVNGQSVSVDFLGWYTSTGTDGREIKETDTVDAYGDVTLYAKFASVSDIEKLVDQAMKLNANHYTMESLEVVDTALKAIMDEHKADAAATTKLQEAMDALVELHDDGGAPAFHVFENKEVVGTELTSAANAGKAYGDLDGSTLSSIFQSDTNGDIGYVYPGKNFYTYYCYTNSENPLILVSTEDVKNAEAAESDRVSYPTKFAGTGGVKTEISTQTGTVSSGWMQYDQDEKAVNGRAAGYDVGSQQVGNQYADTLTYVGSKCGDGEGYGYYQSAGYLVLRPTFVKQTAGDKQYALYTISAYDDSLNSLPANNSKLAGAGDYGTFKDDGTDLTFSADQTVTPLNTITVYVEYFNSMYPDDNGGYRTDAGGQTAKNGVGTSSGSYLNAYTTFADGKSNDQKDSAAKDCAWTAVDYLYRVSGGFTSEEATINFIEPQDKTDGKYEMYLGNDPQFRQNDIGSFYYLLDPTENATTAYWEAYDNVIEKNPYDKAAARKAAAAAATAVMNEKVRGDMDTGKLSYEYLNKQQQAIVATFGDYISWPFNTSTKHTTQFYAPAKCREEALVYVHIYDRYGNEFTTVLQRNFQDLEAPTIASASVGQVTINETGYSSIRELRLTQYTYGGSNLYVERIGGQTDDGGWTVSGNTFTMTNLGPGNHNYVYTLSAIDNAGNVVKLDVNADPTVNGGSISVTINDVCMGGDYAKAAMGGQTNDEDDPASAPAPSANEEDALTMMSIDNVEMAEIAADQIDSAVTPVEEPEKELPDVYSFTLNETYTVNLFVPGEDPHDISLLSTEGGVIKAYINGIFARPDAGIIHVPGNSDVQIRVATKSGYELSSLTMVYPDGTATDLTGAYNAEITENVKIKAIFRKTDAKLRIEVVNGGINGKPGAFVSPYSMVTVAAYTAPAGKKFAYWALGDADGEPVSYDASYTFIATSNTTLTAVYSDAAVDKIASVAMDEASSANITLVNGRYSLAYSGRITLPEGATIKEHGMILTNQSADQCTDENFVIGGTINGVSSFKLVGETLTEQGQFKMNVNNVAPGATRTGRMYLIVQLADGTIQTIYSNTWSSLRTPKA